MPSELEAILLSSKPASEEEVQVDRVALNLSRSGSANIQLPRVKKDINNVHEGLKGELSDLECKLKTQSCTTDKMAEVIQEMSMQLTEFKEGVLGVGQIGQEEAKSTEKKAPQIEANVTPDSVFTKLQELESQQEEMRNWLKALVASVSSARWERLDSDVARLRAQLQREANETLTEAHTQKQSKLPADPGVQGVRQFRVDTGA